MSGEVIGQYPDDPKVGIIYIDQSSSYITIDSCYIYNAADVSDWDVETVVARFGTGIKSDGVNCQIINSHFNNTRWPIVITHNGTGTVIRNNLIENISEDGVRCCASYMLIENNVLKNWYGLTLDHDDGFQAWTGGYDSSHPVGSETIYGGIIRGNIIISSLPGNPFPPTYGTQGIGWFDGMFEDFVVENNLICTSMFHGITFLGAKNCKILNNTVVENPYDSKNEVPWISITKHKPGGPYSDAPSTGNIIRNNIAPRFENDANIGEVDHNLLTTDYAALFVDYAGLDFHLKAISAAVDAGISTDAPSTDLDQNNRTEPYDIGCYELTYVNNGDTIPPSAPTGLVSTDVTMLSADLTWNASTDNTNVTDYRVYINGADPVTVQGTSATIAPLSPNTSYSFTVTALDAVGNESDQSTAIAVTTDELTSITSSASWQTIAVSNQTGTFSASFDVVPNNNNMDGVVGILDGNATTYSSLACIIRFNSSGQIDAIDGTNGYSSSNTINYSAGTNYHFRAEVDILSHTYTLYVTPEGQTEITLGTNYAFRNEQSNVSSLNGIALTAASGTHTLSNISIVSGGTPPTNPTSVSISPPTLSLDEGEISNLTETVLPLNASDLSVTWSSSNTSVVTVDANGLVTAFGAGTATITVTTNVGGFTDNCDITVNGAVVPFNVAFHKPISVTAYQNGNPGTHLVDGDIDATRWSAEGFPQSADIDLGKNYDLTSIEVYPMGNRAYQYTIEASTDGLNYVQIVDRSSNTEGVQTITDAVSTTARYIKIEVLGASGYTGTWVSLNELKVFGLSNVQNIPVTGVSVLPTSVALEVGQSVDLTESVTPSNASNQSVTWLSDNPSVATVTANGLVTAIAEGSCSITVTTNNGGFTANCTVTVTTSDILVTGVSVSPTNLILDQGQTSSVVEAVSPSNATDQSVSWSSSNVSVATVDANGLVSALSEGNCTITVTTNDGGFTADCDVTVNGSGSPATGFIETCGTGTASTINAYSGWDNAGTITYTGYNTSPGFNTVDATISSTGYTGASGGSYVTIAPGFTETAWFIIDGINTLGMTDVELSFGIYFHSITAKNYLEVSYSTDGTNWTVVQNSNSFPAIETWGLMTYTGLPAVSNLIIKFEELYRKSVYFDDIMVNGSVSSIPVTGVSVSPATLSLNEGETSDLAEFVSPTNATDQSVTWSSSNTSIATVDANGLVSAQSEGNCTITLTTNDGGFTADCDVTVIGIGGFIETCGTGTASTINAYSGWDNAGTITYTGYNTSPGFNTVDATISSTGYTGASGGSYVTIAPGFTETAWFIIDGINTLGMTDVELNFGIYFHSITAKNYLEVSYSTDGTNWTVVQNSNSFPAIETWGLMTYTGLPAASNLRIKFEELYRKSVYFDDIIVAENSGTPSKSNSFSKTDALKSENSPDIKIMPNPVPENGQYGINLKNYNAYDKLSIWITDLTGKTIFIQNNIKVDSNGNRYLRLDAALTKGIYFISANNGKCIKTNKLIVN